MKSQDLDLVDRASSEHNDDQIDAFIKDTADKGHDKSAAMPSSLEMDSFDVVDEGHYSVPVVHRGDVIQRQSSGFLRSQAAATTQDDENSLKMSNRSNAM